MRILILYPFLVRPGSLGGVARVTRLVEHLDALGHDVRLACFATAEEIASGLDLREVRGHCREMVVLPLERRGLLRRLAALASPSCPSVVDYFRSAEMRREIRRILRSGEVDVFHVEFTYLADYVAEAAGAGCATVLVDEELNFAAERRRFATAGLSARGLRALWEARRFERYEPRAAQRFDKVLAITEREREILLAGAPRLDVEVYPNAVDTAYFTPLEVAPEPGRLVFVGNFEHYPNADGISWFVREILPLIRAEVACAALDVIGANASAAVRALHDGESVRVLGYVPDIRPHVARAAAFVCPLVNGGGMRGKALEAMAMARPVVATPIGLEGIAAEDGRHALIAREPDAFAAAVCRLLRDPALAAALGGAGRELVRGRYDDAVVFGELVRTYSGLANGAGAPHRSGCVPTPRERVSGA